MLKRWLVIHQHEMEDHPGRAIVEGLNKVEAIVRADVLEFRTLWAFLGRPPWTWTEVKQAAADSGIFRLSVTRIG